MKKRIFLVAGVLFVALAIIFFACSKSYNAGMSGGGGTNPNTITMKNSIFSNPNITVAAGTTVTWVNDDNMIHTVTADNGSFDSGDLNPGMSFSHAFTTAGTFNYHCVRHSNMIGAVVVTGG